MLSLRKEGHEKIFPDQTFCISNRNTLNKLYPVWINDRWLFDGDFEYLYRLFSSISVTKYYGFYKNDVCKGKLSRKIFE